MRLALAQMNSVVGDLEETASASSSGSSRRARGRASRPLSRARRHGLPARGSPVPPGLRPRRRAGAGADRARGARRRRAGRTPVLDRDLANGCAICADGEVQAIYRKRFLPNYGVFDEDRYFAPGRDLLLLDPRRRARRADDLRGHLAARPARDRPRPRRGRADREHLRVALPRRQGPRARADARPAGARQLVLHRARERRRRPGRADLRRALASSSTTRGTVLARAPGFEEALLVVDVDLPRS